MFKKILLFFLFCFLANAQNNAFQKKYDAFINANKKDYAQIDSFFKEDRSDTIRLQYALAKCRTTKSIATEAYIANKLGVYYRDFSNYKRALEYHNDGLVLSQKIKNSALMVVSYNMLGVVYRRMDSIKPAIDNYKQALRIIDKVKKPLNENFLRSKAIALNSLGNIYQSLNQFDLALKTFDQSIKIESGLKNNLGLAINYQNIGGVFETQNKLDLALENYKKSLEYNKIINSEIGFMICNNSIGSVLLKQDKAKEAFDYIFPTIATAEKTNDSFYISSSYINLGWAYLKLNQIEKATKNIEFGLNIALKKNLTSYIASAYKLLSEIAERKGNFKEANDYLKKYYANNEKVSGEKNLKYVFDFITAYENEKKANVLKLKDEQLKLNKLSIEASRKQLALYLLGMGLLAIIGGLLFYQSYNRKKTNKELQVLNADLDLANKTKTRFFTILNHDLRAPVANLIGFLHLQKESPELLDEKDTVKLQNKTIAGAENLLTSMESMLLWSKGQMENFEPNFTNTTINAIFEDTRNHFLSEEKVKITFENIQSLEINTDEDYLKTIIRNLTGNAIKALKATEKPTIIWKGYTEENQNYLSITDNGMGGNQEKFKALYDDTHIVGIKTGLGLHLIRDLATAINCEITVDSKIGVGTTFVLKLK
jgi:signal transduction histidine kinase/Tfp pilus assembly protein PilF